MTPGIHVPEQYRGPRPTTTPNDYVINCIRDVIRANPSRILRVEDFQQISGTNYASIVLGKLLEKGHVERLKVKTGRKGHAYTYKWHDTPHRAPVNGLTVQVMETIDKHAQDFIDDLAGTNQTQQIDGVLQFKKYLWSKIDQSS